MTGGEYYYEYLEENCVKKSFKLITKIYAYEISWIITNNCKNTGKFGDNQEYTTECCLPPGQYTLKCSDSHGDGWNGGKLVDEKQNVYCEGGGHWNNKTETINVNPIMDCQPTTIHTTTVKHGDQVSWTIGNDCKSGSYTNDQQTSQTCCLPLGLNYLQCKDSYGDGWNGGFVTINGVKYCKTGSSWSEKIFNLYTQPHLPPTTPSTVVHQGQCNWNYGIPNFINEQVDSDGRNLIVSGGTAKFTEYPWQAQIYHTGFCGGSIIARRWILTAAHCGGTGKRVTVKVAEQSLTYHGTMICHPKYNQLLKIHDICLVKLDVDLPCNNNGIRAISIGVHQVSLNGCSLWVTGRGRLWGGGYTVNHLRELQTKYWKHDNYNCKYNIGPTRFCSFSPTNTYETACNGDSGGPVFIDIDVSSTSHQYVQVGCVSFGKIGCKKGYGTVHTNVVEYKSWIQTYVPEAHFQEITQCDKKFYREGPTSDDVLTMMKSF